MTTMLKDPYLWRALLDEPGMYSLLVLNLLSDVSNMQSVIEDAELRQMLRDAYDIYGAIYSGRAVKRNIIEACRGRARRLARKYRWSDQNEQQSVAMLCVAVLLKDQLYTLVRAAHCYMPYQATEEERGRALARVADFISMSRTGRVKVLRGN